MGSRKGVVQEQHNRDEQRCDPLTANDKLKIADVAAAFAEVYRDNVEAQLQLGQGSFETNSISTTKVAAGSERGSSRDSQFSTFANSLSRSNHGRQT